MKHFIVMEDKIMLDHLSSRTLKKLSFYVDDVVFPCSKHELLKYAEHNYAPEGLLNAIEELPESICRNVDEVIDSIMASKQVDTRQFA